MNQTSFEDTNNDVPRYPGQYRSNSVGINKNINLNNQSNQSFKPSSYAA